MGRLGRLTSSLPLHLLPSTLRLSDGVFADVEVNAAGRRGFLESRVKFCNRSDNAAFTCAGAHEPSDFGVVSMLDVSRFTRILRESGLCVEPSEAPDEQPSRRPTVMTGTGAMAGLRVDHAPYACDPHHPK